MNKQIEKYLDDLRDALLKLDRSTIQDALADAEDHLSAALQVETEERPDVDRRELLLSIIEKYGTPEEIRDQYSDIEEITTPVFASSKKQRSKGFKSFCEIVAEPKAWAACLYMILSMVTGIFYFTWVTTGLSVSLGLLVLIIGIPIALLFLLSVRGLGFVEGRMVEALLGVRMPRRAITPGGRRENWWAKFKIILTTRSTWTTTIYMFLLMPLGIIYFTLIVTLFSLGLSLIGAPVMQYIFHEPLVDPGIWVPFYAMPFIVAAGGMLIVLTLHLAKAIGNLHGRFAKTMLVS
ncbi:MAG: sensor domain-containing protein [Candidatus Sabulitectum sp.]|nr:sensor domain-containing protein [Candidatus Sabulitectum sp.]